MSEILADLNPSQREAVQHQDGPLMVLAGAGSGKTRVITRRIAWLLENGVDPHQMLALTFTNKAAGEMAGRVSDLGGYRVHVSTFHSACARFMRKDGHHLGYPSNFSIYDTYDRDSCIKQLAQSLGIPLGSGVTPNRIGGRISRLKNLGIGPDEFTSGMGEVDLVVRQIYRPYVERMMDLGAMDFDDLLVRFTELLGSYPDVAEAYQERFRYVLVDEFQDTNLVQYQMIKHLVARHRKICVVGDPDQSIYKFRGADIRNILEFENDFPDAHTIRLEVNYRSTACILAAAQAVIENNKGRLDKTLRTEAEFGAKITIHRAESEVEEAADVTRQIANLVREGVSLDEVAVFYRTHFLSRAIEQALRQWGVPYEIVGGLTFFERREIKDLLAYLRVVVNPLDDVSMLRIINVPPRGLGKVNLQKLIDTAADEEMSLYEAVCDAGARGVVARKARDALGELAEVLIGIRADQSPSEAIQRILEGTNYKQYACNLGDPQDVSREENIDELINDAVQNEKEYDGGLAGYLQHVSLLTSQDEERDPGPRATLMSVHSSKGLEFDHVFVLGLEDGIFPHARSFDQPAEMEEERRLMYVALTRARQTVFLGHARYRMTAGETRRQDVSRFLAEIPDDCTTRPKARFHEWEQDDDDFDDFDGDDDVGDVDGGELCAGTKVVHPTYGLGEVMRVSGDGVRMRVVVRFSDGREKTLIPEYADLHVMPGEQEW